MFPIVHAGVSEECDEAFLKGLKAALDLAFGLWGGGYYVRYVECLQGSLELAAGIGVIVAGTWSKQAQGIGVDRFWQTMALEGLAKMLEVIPSGVTFHEASCNVEA